MYLRRRGSSWQGGFWQDKDGGVRDSSGYILRGGTSYGPGLAAPGGYTRGEGAWRYNKRLGFTIAFPYLTSAFGKDSNDKFVWRTLVDEAEAVPQNDGGPCSIRLPHARVQCLRLR